MNTAHTCILSLSLTEPAVLPYYTIISWFGIKHWFKQYFFSYKYDNVRLLLFWSFLGTNYIAKAF